MITGTRGFELSSALYTHEQLVRLGVETDLHVWEGLFHGFFYNVDVPESKDALNVIVKFFDRHLGGSDAALGQKQTVARERENAENEISRSIDFPCRGCESIGRS